MFLFIPCFSGRLVPLLAQHKTGWKISIDGRNRLTETATITLANETQLEKLCVFDFMDTPVCSYECQKYGKGLLLNGSNLNNIGRCKNFPELVRVYYERDRIRNVAQLRGNPFPVDWKRGPRTLAVPQSRGSNPVRFAIHSKRQISSEVA